MFVNLMGWISIIILNLYMFVLNETNTGCFFPAGGKKFRRCVYCVNLTCCLAAVTYIVYRDWLR